MQGTWLTIGWMKLVKRDTLFAAVIALPGLSHLPQSQQHAGIERPRSHPQTSFSLHLFQSFVLPSSLAQVCRCIELLTLARSLQCTIYCGAATALHRSTIVEPAPTPHPQVYQKSIYNRYDTRYLTMPAISLRHVLFLLTTASMASAQTTALNIIPTSSSGTFPACAISCAVLVDSQAQCEPPTAAQGSNTQYENCFCQNPALAPLYTTPNALCTTECPNQSDRAELQVWFQQFCQKVGQGIDPLVTAQSTTLVTITSTSAPSTSSTSSAPVATFTNSGTTQQASSNHQSWFVSPSLTSLPI